MVDPRIYRAGLALVAVAVIVFGFSLQAQPGGATTTLAPPSLAPAPYTTMLGLAGAYPSRAPGSPGDDALAGRIAAQLGSNRNFAVAVSRAPARTALGERTLETVTATRVGLTPGAIVVVAPRDTAASPATAELSGTAVLLGLARTLAGETENHTLILASTSGSVGAAGAGRLAGSLAGQPVDAVIVLGDLAAAHATEPVVDPWSDAAVLAPPMLRRTLSYYVGTQTGLSGGSTSLGGQIAHLAFPLTTTDQGPFGRAGLAAVSLSLAGNRVSGATEPVSAIHIGALQNAVWQSVNALDAAPRVPAPSAYLLIDGQMVPLWAVRLLVLALILPVAGATMDGLARTRRRGHSILRWIAWTLAGCVPFLAGLAALLLARLTGVVPTPPGAVGAGGISFGGAEIALVVVVALLMGGALLVLRPLCIRLASRLGEGERRPSSPAGDAAAMGVAVVMCLAAVLVWVVNPFAAAVLVPALHLWLWLPQPGLRARRPLALGLIVLGLVPPLLVAAYYAHSFGLNPFALLWSGALAVAGGQVAPAMALLWSVVLGAVVSITVIALRSGPAAKVAPAAVTVRGPASYAGPGSLGGTESALGSRR
jgi:hypothetical protein